MQVTVKLFAVFRDRAGAGEILIGVPDDCTAGDVVAAVVGRYPELKAFEHRVAVAVNLETVPRDARIRPGDEIALIPPVSGGAV